MVTKITFCGFCKHLNELDFDYVVIDNDFNDLTHDQAERFDDKIIWHSSGLPDSPQDDEETKRKKRWLRIASNLLRAVEFAEEYGDDIIAIFDSDIIIPKLNEIKINELILTPCYWLYYPWAGEVRPFCSGTNYILSRNRLGTLKYYIQQYDPSKGPVDIYLHDRIPHINVLVNGTVHYVKANGVERRMVLTINDVDMLCKHIPEVFVVIP